MGDDEMKDDDVDDDEMNVVLTIVDNNNQLSCYHVFVLGDGDDAF